MFNEISLTQEQQQALEKLEETLTFEGEAVLSGPAGSGKTTVLRELIDLFRGRPICLLAPTGKAARRMTEVIGYRANTIHSALYGGCDEGEDKKGRTKLTFYDPQPPCRPKSLVVIDEASMVNRDLYETLKEQVQLVKTQVQVIMVMVVMV